jgi:hypothetical protein
LYVHNPDYEPRKQEIKKSAQVELAAAAAKVLRSRANLEWRISECGRIVENANALSKFYGWRWRLKMPVFDPEKLEKIRAANRAAEARAEQRRVEAQARREERYAKQAAEDKEKREAWLRGEPVHYPYEYYSSDTLLRVYGNNVETSRGAEVPVEHAKRLWPIIEKVRARGEPYVRNGHSEHVGNFVVDRIDVTGDMKVGCHFIKYDQVWKIANQLGLTQ